MKKLPLLLLMFILFLGACSADQKDGVLLVNFKCGSEQIFRIDYLAYTDGEYLCMGGMADYDKEALKDRDDMAVPFQGGDLTLEDGTVKQLSLELHLYGADEQELAAIPATVVPGAPGGECTVTISEDGQGGFRVEAA